MTHSLCLVVLDGRTHSYTAHRTLVFTLINHSNLSLILIQKSHVRDAGRRKAPL